jgi:predicted GNAT family acetyltransferase
MTEDNVVVRLDEDWHRYLILIDGEVAGVAHFLPHGNQRVFTHTVVDDRFEGQGIGSQLVRHALDDVRAKGLRIVPVCPFVAAYLAKHHDWDDIIDPPKKNLMATVLD